jgi:hypothetical protein
MPNSSRLTIESLLDGATYSGVLDSAEPLRKNHARSRFQLDGLNGTGY